MRGCPARHVPCDAYYGHEPIEAGSLHEQPQHAGVLPLPHAHAHRRDASGELAAAAEQGRAGEESLHARSIHSFSTQHFYFTAYSHHKEEPPFLDTFSSEFQRS